MNKINILLTAITFFPCAYGQKTTLKFNADGKFKIVQFTDLHHLLTQSEFAIAEVMPRVLDTEKPDLVVFTGDIVTGSPQQKGWDRVLQPVIDRKIPYAVTLGNHDDEHDWTREQIAAYIEKLPFSLFRRGPKNIKGVGNFVLELKNRAGKTSTLLYFMDSGAYNEVDGHKSWGSFALNQVEWYGKTSRTFTKRNHGNPFPALAFFHIPLEEYRLLSAPDIFYYCNPVAPAPVIGERGRQESPGLNTGMFSAIQEAGDVIATFVGHDHRNNYIGCLDGVALVYGQFTGSHYEACGARIIELQENRRGFDTWIRRVDKAQDPNLITRSVEYRTNYPEDF